VLAIARRHPFGRAACSLGWRVRLSSIVGLTSACFPLARSLAGAGLFRLVVMFFRVRPASLTRASVLHSGLIEGRFSLFIGRAWPWGAFVFWGERGRSQCGFGGPSFGRVAICPRHCGFRWSEAVGGGRRRLVCGVWPSVTIVQVLCLSLSHRPGSATRRDAVEMPGQDDARDLAPRSSR